MIVKVTRGDGNKTADEQIAELKRNQELINKAFEEEIELLKQGQEETSKELSTLNEMVSGLTEEVSENMLEVLNVNHTVRRELTKFTDLFIEERKESARREHEQKVRAEEAKRERSKNTIDLLKDWTMVGGIIYLIVQHLLGG